MCPSNRFLVLTLLTKCGVVVGVFGLGPKGRGLDSLHLLVPNGAAGEKNIFILKSGCPIGVPTWVPDRVPIRGPEGARKKEHHEVEPKRASGNFGLDRD